MKDLVLGWACSVSWSGCSSSGAPPALQRRADMAPSTLNRRGYPGLLLPTGRSIVSVFIIG